VTPHGRVGLAAGRPCGDLRSSSVDALGQIGFTLPGSVVTRTVTCGRATCRCATDPDQRYGPYTGVEQNVGVRRADLGS
jgi:hypothetical protein